MAPKGAGFVGYFFFSNGYVGLGFLTSESVQSTALPLEGVHYIHGSDGLPLGMLGVGDGVTDDVLQENLEDTTGLLVDEARDTLDTTSSSKTTDSGLGDTLDIITKNLAVVVVDGDKKKNVGTGSSGRKEKSGQKRGPEKK